MSHLALAAAIEEPMMAGHPYLNYCCWPYQPPRPGLGKLRPSSLLFRAIAELPQADWFTETIRAIQSGVGDFRCVYGIKRVGGRWALEVYVYDYGRQDRVLSVERFFAACAGRLSCVPKVPPQLPYFMFSFDLCESMTRCGGRVEAVNVYVGNPGSQVSSGLSYQFTAAERRFENAYFFFDAQRQREAIAEKIVCSAFWEGAEGDLDRVMPQELRDCHTICLANKRSCDTVYFSGVTIDQLLFFLHWQVYPADFTRFVADRAGELDHLLFDVGIDYRMQNSQLALLKSGIYGIF